LELWTRERVENEYVPVRESFRAYSSRALGARDYVQLLKRRYPKAFLAVRHGEVREFVDALRLGGYFTDDAGLYARAMQSLWFEYLSTGVAARAYDQVI
jgi:flagellum-specific peptidoglycan hydrolase FlgJ